MADLYVLEYKTFEVNFGTKIVICVYTPELYNIIYTKNICMYKYIHYIIMYKI